MKALLPLLFFSAASGAQLTGSSAEVQGACAKAMAAPLPYDMNTLPVPANYPDCDSFGLYAKKDFSAARACAIQERAYTAVHGSLGRAPFTPGNPYGTVNLSGGGIVLTELYANGEGVTQSPALAARFMCEAVAAGDIEGASGGEFELAKVLATLDRLKTRTVTSARFLFCDPDNPSDISPEMPSTRYCVGLWQEAHDAVHAGGIQAGMDQAQQDSDEADEAIKPILAGLTPVQRAAYDRLAAADRKFIDAQATGDLLYMGGYGSGGLYPDEMHAEFEEKVVELSAKHPTAPTPAEFAAADAALNKAYLDLIATITPSLTVIGRKLNPENLRIEERAWIAYRDAFIAFGKTLDENLPASAWMLPLTNDRTEMLDRVLEDAGRQKESDLKFSAHP